MADQNCGPPLPQKERTLGDGMDNAALDLVECNKMSIHRRTPTVNFKPVEPRAPVHHLVPKYVPKERKHPKYLVRKPKEPKFVPYEPYKGAVEPIIPRKIEPKLYAHQRKTSRTNNVEIQELVCQMAEMRAAEMNKLKEEAVQNEEAMIPRRQWEKERGAYETDLRNLRETNAHLENQLKFQAQVNSELKTLLVAAVGEDLEVRVQHLTEDKLQLARALLKSANHLTSHQEQTEWLSGQCEVWRSKFLASSLMVEELARWKSALSTRINDLQDTLKSILDDHHHIQKKSLRTCSTLTKILPKLSPNNNNDQNLTTCNIVQLSNVNCDLAQHLSDSLQVECDALSDELSALPRHTVSETLAMKLLHNPVFISNQPQQDAICNALMGTALTLNGGQMYLQHPSSHATCCAHCMGEVKNV